MYQDSELKKDFYTQMCRIEKWDTRTLQKKINSMLFERTAISKKPEELAKLEVKKLEHEDIISPDLVFRDHYVLDFLNLKDEELPIGLILCAEGNQEQIELLQLDKANIKVAEYISKQLPQKLLSEKLHQFAETARKLLENRTKEI